MATDSMDTKWLSILTVIKNGDLSTVTALACPECGGALKIDFLKRPQRSAIYVECQKCGHVVRAQGPDRQPSWVVSDHATITTNGGVT